MVGGNEVKSTHKLLGDAGEQKRGFSYLCQFLVIVAWTIRLATCIEMLLEGVKRSAKNMSEESCTVYEIVIIRSVKPYTVYTYRL